MGETRRQSDPLLGIRPRAVGAGLVGGLVAGVVMGIVLQFGTGLIPEFGAFAGERSVLRGWLVHLLLSTAYGVAFAVVVAYPAVRDFFDTFGSTEYVLVGVTYSTMVAAVTIGILPFAFEVPWAPGSRASQRGAVGAGFGGLVPAMLFAVGHLVYGAVLGAVYAAAGTAAE